MEIKDYAYIPLMILLDEDVKVVNHPGMSAIGWYKGLTGNWSIDKLAEVVVHLDSGDLRYIMTMTPRMHKVLHVGEQTESDSKYIASILMTITPAELYHYEKIMLGGYKYTIKKGTRILSKITEKGIEYVAVRS